MSRVSEGLLQWAGHSGDTSGCTAVMAVAVDDSYLVAHVGDSRAVLCQQEPGRGMHALSDASLWATWCTESLRRGTREVQPTARLHADRKEALCE